MVAEATAAKYHTDHEEFANNKKLFEDINRLTRIQMHNLVHEKVLLKQLKFYFTKQLFYHHLSFHSNSYLSPISRLVSSSFYLLRSLLLVSQIISTNKRKKKLRFLFNHNCKKPR